jgi:hypothetical protein
MFLDDIYVNHMATIAAALVYYILGAIWYLPCFFGTRHLKHDEIHPEENSTAHTIAAYIFELVLDLIIAYILTLFITISRAEDILDGITVSLWIWMGFIATTHFSAVLWGRKSLKSFFIHACFMLIGFLAMGGVIMYLS